MSGTATAVLFDIDGTVMKTRGAGREALSRAAAELWGVEVDTARDAAAQIDFRGATDTLIFGELARKLGQPWGGFDDPLTAAYLRQLDTCLETAEIIVLPGVRALLAVLALRGTEVGLLTGNIKEGARAKLARLQLEHLVDRPGGFGEDGDQRAELARAAVARLKSVGVSPAATVVIGDTEHDVSAAHAAGAAAVAVSTGWTERSVLDQCGAQLVVDDLSDPQPLLAMLDQMTQGTA